MTMNKICKSAYECFLNCCHCPVAEKATKKEKAEAKKRLKEHRKKIGITS